MPNAIDYQTFLAKWRESIRVTLPRFKSELAKIGIVGTVTATAVVTLANDPTLAAYSGILAGLGCNFISNAVERWRGTADDAAREAQFRQIAEDVAAHRDDPHLQSVFRELDLISASIDILGSRLDVLTELVKMGFATQQQITNVTINTGGGTYIGGALDIHGDYVDTKIVEATHYTQNVLHQLHRVPDNFTGRSQEIEAVVKQIRTGFGQSGAASYITSIVGTGGIGKTELANAIGHFLSDDFPDAQLFVDLRASNPPQLMPAQALQYCIRSFAHDVEEKLPDDASTLRRIYLSKLNGKHALVILDDSHDDAHIASLLPPPGCVAIITSRNALATGVPLRLGFLQPDESIKLLTMICPHLSESDADTLATLCCNLPFALTIAGGYLKTHRSVLPHNYIDTLRGPFAFNVSKLRRFSTSAITP